LLAAVLVFCCHWRSCLWLRRPAAAVTCHKYKHQRSRGSGHGSVEPGGAESKPGGVGDIYITPDASYHTATITDNGRKKSVAKPPYRHPLRA